MLTKEMFISLKNGVAVHGDGQLKHASRVAAVIEKYAAELVEVTVGEGENVRVLKWNELPELYKECFVQAMLMEYGWQEAKIDDRRMDEPVTVPEKETAADTPDNSIWGEDIMPARLVLPLGWGVSYNRLHSGSAKEIWMRFVQYVCVDWARKSKGPLTVTIDKNVVENICKISDPEEIRAVLSDVADLFQEIFMEHQDQDRRMKRIGCVFQTVSYDEDEDDKNLVVYAEASDLFANLVKAQMAINESECAGQKDE